MNSIKNIVLYHNDFDGLASATIIIKYYNLSDYLALNCEPFNLKKIYKQLEQIYLANNRENFQKIFLVDIALNNKGISLSLNFIKMCSKFTNEITIFDHHNGWEHAKKLLNLDNIKIYVNPKFKSCAFFIKNFLNLNDEFLNNLSFDANIIDSGETEGASKLSILVNNAIKSELKNSVLKDYALNFMLSQYNDNNLYNILREYASKYDEIYKKSLEVLNTKIKEINPNLCYLDLKDEIYDLTLIITQCYKKYPFVVIEYSTKGGIFNIVATNKDNVDLVLAFGLKSGLKKRITIPKESCKNIVEKIEKYYKLT